MDRKFLLSILSLAPAFLLSSGNFLVDQMFASRISQSALYAVSISFYLPLVVLVIARSIGPAFNIVYSQDKSIPENDRSNPTKSNWFASANSMMVILGFVIATSYFLAMPFFISSFELKSLNGSGIFLSIIFLSCFFTLSNTFMTFVLITSRRNGLVLWQNFLVFLINIIGDVASVKLLNGESKQLVGIACATLLSQVSLAVFQRFILFSPRETLRFSNPNLFFNRAKRIFGWDILNGFMFSLVPVWTSYVILHWGGDGLTSAAGVGARLDHFLSVGAISAVNVGYGLMADNIEEPEILKNLLVKITKISILTSGIPYFVVCFAGGWILTTVFGMSGQDQTTVAIASLVFGVEFVFTSGCRSLLRCQEKTKQLAFIEQGVAVFFLVLGLALLWIFKVPPSLGIPLCYSAAAATSGSFVCFFAMKSLNAQALLKAERVV